jgi:hypothetical protein
MDLGLSGKKAIVTGGVPIIFRARLTPKWLTS